MMRNQRKAVYIVLIKATIHRMIKMYLMNYSMKIASKSQRRISELTTIFNKILFSLQKAKFHSKIFKKRYF